MRILIADDDQDIQRLLGRILKSWGHEVVTADHGGQALEILKKDPISFVISDWMMPEMDGLELCRHIRNSDFGRYIYIILLTARDAKNDLIHGMEAGADDFVVKPFNRGELKVRIRAGERILALERDLVDANTQIQHAYDRINKDLEAGAEMQRSLLPPPDLTIPGFKMSWIFFPSAFVAGDIFNMFQLDEDHVGFYLLDVAGHGVPSAMLSVTLSRILSPIPDSPLKYAVPGEPNYEISSPVRVLEDLNERFQADDETMQYFTMVYGMINKKENTLQLAPAGHPPTIHVPHNDKIAELGLSSFPIGLLPGADFDLETTTFKPGDRLFLYSDGIPECFNPELEAYSQERLLARLEEWRALPLPELLDLLEKDLRDWHGEDDFSDDLTLMAIEME